LSIYYGITLIADCLVHILSASNDVLNVCAV